MLTSNVLAYSKMTEVESHRATYVRFVLLPRWFRTLHRFFAHSTQVLYRTMIAG